jgi:hypothetical protein
LQEASPQNILIKRRKYKGRGGAKNLTLKKKIKH